jgi:hypothetical protein
MALSYLTMSSNGREKRGVLVLFGVSVLCSIGAQDISPSTSQGISVCDRSQKKDAGMLTTTACSLPSRGESAGIVCSRWKMLCSQMENEEPSKYSTLLRGAQQGFQEVNTGMHRPMAISESAITEPI